MVMIVRCRSDLVNTKENVLPVCDLPFHTSKRKVKKGEKKIEVLHGLRTKLGDILYRSYLTN